MTCGVIFHMLSTFSPRADSDIKSRNPVQQRRIQVDTRLYNGDRSTFHVSFIIDNNEYYDKLD